jgi:hypothetical protein
MNELRVLLDTARGIAWVMFGTTFLVLLGLVIFAGRAAKRSAEAHQEDKPGVRRAA